MLKYRSLARQRGLSIIELLVGATVGLIVVAGASAVYLNSSRGGIDSQRQMRLTQEVRAAVDIMAQDVRRSGYWSGAVAGGTNPFMLRTAGGNATDLYASNGCMLYSYDATFIAANTPNAVDGNDFFGFRRNAATSTLQLLPDNSGLANTAADCGNLNTWQNLTDPAAINVTAAAMTITYSCLSTAGAVTTGAVPCATTGDIETRRVTIAIEAQHASDEDIRTAISETVLLPNHRLVP